MRRGMSHATGSCNSVVQRRRSRHENLRGLRLDGRPLAATPYGVREASDGERRSLARVETMRANSRIRELLGRVTHVIASPPARGRRATRQRTVGGNRTGATTLEYLVVLSLIGLGLVGVTRLLGEGARQAASSQTRALTSWIEEGKRGVPGRHEGVPLPPRRRRCANTTASAAVTASRRGRRLGRFSERCARFRDQCPPGQGLLFQRERSSRRASTRRA
jgi:Flp pilus assembly pilin Flp